MRVTVTTPEGKVVWAHGVARNGNRSGIACTAYLSDGTQKQIISALELALNQAKGEISTFDDGDGMLNIGAATS